eukprot:6145268-Prymnesium_polylepis.1
MPKKGDAFSKPGVNALHKSEVRKLASKLADNSLPLTEALRQALVEISREVNESSLDAARKKDAHSAVKEALRKIERRQDPLTGLSPPALCGPCNGQHGGTHHFFCGRRKREPGIVEKGVRDALMQRVATLFRALLEAAVRARCIRPADRRASLQSATIDADSGAAKATEEDGEGEDGTALDCAAASPQGVPAPALAPELSSTCDLSRATPSSSTAVETSIAAEMDRVVDEAMDAAAGVKAREEMAFNVPEKGRAGWAKVAQREAAWMRVELVKLLDGADFSSLPAGCNADGSVIFRRQRLVRRAGPADEGGGTRVRPEIYDYIVDGSRGHVINFGTKDATLKLEEHGLGSCPCANPDCVGRDGKWHVRPTRWGHKTSAPQVHIFADGLPGPIEVVWAKCED